MVDRTPIALWSIGIIGTTGLVVILGVLWSVQWGSFRAGLAVIMRKAGGSLLRWLDRGRRP